MVFVVLLLVYCRQPMPSFHSLPKIDAHMHLRTVDTTAVHQAREDNMRLLTICVRSGSQQYINEQRRYAVAMYRQFPDIGNWVTTFSMEHFGEQGWADTTISRLKRDFAAGAVAVKVWKDIGMTFRNPDSSFIMIDDPRFEPVLDFIETSNKPLIAHIGEPKNCWLPLDSMTVNSDRGYFSRYLFHDNAEKWIPALKQ